MTNEIVIINAKEFGLNETQTNGIMGDLPQIIKERDILIAQYDDIIKLDVDDPETTKKAKACRLLILKNRTKGINVWHKTNKEIPLKMGQLIDSVKNREIAINERMESTLMDIEKRAERLESERIIALSESRAVEITPFLHTYAPKPIDLGYMQDDVWTNYLLGAKTNYEARVKAETEAERLKIEAEKKAEAERLEKEKKDKEEKERIAAEQKRIEEENKKLKAEAEAKEAARLAELKAIEEKEKAAQKERDRLAKIEADKQAKIQASLKAKADESKRIADKKLAEQKAKADKLAADLKAKAEAEKIESDRLAKAEAEAKEAARLAGLAPEKEKITKWIDSMLIKGIGTEDFSNEGINVCNDIISKFEAFKKWAESQKETIK